jgi:hypothetical protein
MRYLLEKPVAASFAQPEMAVRLPAGLAGVFQEPILGKAQDYYMAFLRFTKACGMNRVLWKPAQHAFAVRRKAVGARDPFQGHGCGAK